MSAAPTDDSRFSVPLYTIGEAARFLGVAPQTFSNWAKGYQVGSRGRRPVVGEPIVTRLSSERNFPSIPFIGLAEGLVIKAFRENRVSLQHIRRAVEVLEREIRLDHALASERLYTDGAQVLFDYARDEHDEELSHLTVVVSQQRVLSEAVRSYLRRITYGPEAGQPSSSRRRPSMRSSSSIPQGRSGSRSSSTGRPRWTALWNDSGPANPSARSPGTSAFRPRTSRTTCVGPSPSRPELFVDRSLARRVVVYAVRQDGNRANLPAARGHAHARRPGPASITK